MSRDGDSSSNIFVRFKQHVDSSVSSGLHTMLGLPSPPSRPQGSSSSSSQVNTNTNTTDSNKSPFTGSSCPRNVTPTRDSPVDSPDNSWTAEIFGTSQYSPSALRNLRQPVPKDLPPDFRANSGLTFDDAFEDLLLASQSLPLPDIIDRVRDRAVVQFLFPAGLPPHVWALKLEMQGVQLSPSFSPKVQSGLSRLQQDLERQAAHVWKRVDGLAAGEVRPSEVLHELGRAVRQLEGTLFDAGESDERPDGDTDGFRQRRPDHDDDLFSVTKSAFAEADRSWDAFVKALSEPPTPPPAARALEQPARRMAKPQDDFVHVTQTTHVSSTDGSTTWVETIKYLDQDGKVIDTVENRYVVEDEDLGHSKATTSAEAGRTSSERKPGWFWR